MIIAILQYESKNSVHLMHDTTTNNPFNLNRENPKLKKRELTLSVRMWSLTTAKLSLKSKPQVVWLCTPTWGIKRGRRGARWK